MVTVNISLAEIKNFKLSKANLDIACNAILNEGFVVLKNIVSLEHLDVLNEKMDKDAKKMMAQKKMGWKWHD